MSSHHRGPGSEDVLDGASLATLRTVIGPERLAAMLGGFLAELDERSGRLHRMPNDELLGCAHGWISMAGHFGFTELQRRAADLHDDLRAGRAARVALEDLQGAASRAITAGRACAGSTR